VLLLQPIALMAIAAAVGPTTEVLNKRV